MSRTRPLLLCALLWPLSAFAQFSGDYQTNIISDVTNNWIENERDYVVGNNTIFVADISARLAGTDTDCSTAATILLPC